MIGSNHTEHIIDLSLLAPSIGNKKPWKFRVVGNVIELYFSGDEEEEQCSNRIKYVNTGAMLQYLRIIIRNFGRRESITLFPRLDNPNLIAYIRMQGDYKPSEEEKLLFEHIKAAHDVDCDSVEWCKNKFKTASRQIEKATNTSVTLLNNERAPEVTSKLNRFVDAQKQANSQSLEKLSREMKLEPKGDKPEIERLCRFNNTEFSDGSLHCGSEKINSDAVNEYILIYTDVENSYSWMTSGEAMSRIHLTLKRCGVFGMAVIPIIEDPEARAWLAEALSYRGWPQIILKLGRIQRIIPSVQQHQSKDKQTTTTPGF